MTASKKLKRNAKGKKMEQWLPLFEHLLSSPASESAAAAFFHPENPKPLPPSTAAFLRLLLSPIPTIPSSKPNPDHNPTIFFQTLPPFLQSQILSFLFSSHSLFDPLLLRSLASHVLSSISRSGQLGFWVHRDARRLLDALPETCRTLPERSLSCQSASGRGPCGSFDVSEECSENFYDPPQWLKEAAVCPSRAAPLLPWLPLAHGSMPGRRIWRFGTLSEGHGSDLLTQEKEAALASTVAEPLAPPESPLTDSAVERAVALQKEMVAVESASEALHVAKDAQKLCLESGNAEMVLSLVQPWEASDDTAKVLLSNIVLGEDAVRGYGPALVLSSVVLAKLLGLQRPASSVLLSATLDFCKLHPAAAVEALLFPLALRKEGLNAPLCDVLLRIIKDCMHPLHVTAFCHRLLSQEEKDRRLVCMPQHRENIADKLVWTESLFVLFYSILNQDIRLTPDTSEHLAFVIDEMAPQFSKSLKFGNFVLCFLTKCGRAAKLHKVLLERAAERTETFVTKAMLTKLRNL